MSKDKNFHDYLLSDVFQSVDGITSKSMFGGYGFYRYGVIFGIIADGKLYFKVGEGNKKDYEDAGSQPFQYPMRNGKMTTMSYWEAPTDVLENKDQLENWINKSLQENNKKKK